jgi:hypothetical protein
MTGDALKLGVDQRHQALGGAEVARHHVVDVLRGLRLG